MKIGIIGTGTVGQTLAAKLSEQGHEVMIGTRDVQATLAKTTGDAYGGPSFSVWHAEHPSVKLGTFEEAAQHGEFLFNATHGGSSIAALQLAGAGNMKGKVLIDVSNPLDFSKGMPPTLIAGLCNDTSLGEEIQKAFPETKVVKALNTMWCGLMVNPNMLDKGDHHVFTCGNNPEAKTQVAMLLTEFGWTCDRILDLGDISAARGTEMLLPLWLRIMGTLGNGAFNLKVVQA
jgi:predicted dinucleotide-binding enzyme